MSLNFAHIKNKLKRGGLSRPERHNAALAPESVAIDGRQTEDMLQFIYSFARQVNYYQDDPLNPTSDWLPFFQKSVPFQYATIAAYDLDALEQQYQQLAGSIDSRLTFASLNPLFDLLFALTDQIARWRKDLENDEAGLKSTIDNLVDTNLRDWATQLLGLANSGTKWGYSSPGLNNRQKEVFFGTTGIIPELFAVDRRIIVLRGSTKHRVLAAKDILEEIYRVFWKALEAIVITAQDADRLEQSLNISLANHLPHLGLMFSFIKLFEEVQGSLNNLSTAHIDFFYRQTLQLQELPHRKDQAHVIFELGKQVEEDILIDNGQRFKAGKDDNGKDIFFALGDDTIVTKASVAELKTLFIDQDGSDPSSIPASLLGVYNAPVANSADGLGEAFAKDGPQSWATVGSKESKALDLDIQPAETKNHPTATLGFVVASKVLFLREGTRTIDLKIKLDNDCLSDYDQEQLVEQIDGVSTEISPERPALPLFDLYLSTEEGWTLLSGSNPLWTMSDDRASLETQIVLQNDFLSVMYPGKEVLGEDYGHQLPMIKAEFNQELAKHIDETSSWYWELRQQTITQVCIDVEVNDVKQLVLQNDFAVVDPNKPFQPFGPLPKAESSKFYIGSEEIFCKNWSNININIEWKDKPALFSDYYAGYLGVDVDIVIPSETNIEVDISVLSKGEWVSGNINKELFNDFAPSTLVCPETPGPPTVLDIGFTGIETCEIDSLQNGYTNDLQCGFMCLKLGVRDFLHDKYAQVLTEQAAKKANDQDVSIDQARINALITSIQALETDLNSVDALPVVYPSYTSTVSKVTIDSLEIQSNNILSEINNLNDDIIDVIVPNPPYTPLIETISLDYCANDSTDKEAHFTHLHPWTGTYEHLPLDGEQAPQHGNTLLPCFIDEGALFIGLSDYNAGSILPLYFELEPSTADPDLDKAIVCWEYLRANTWHPLRQDIEVLSDTTEGLIQPGIVTMAIPAAISSEETTIMPADKHWIKARVLLRTKAIAETLLVSSKAAVLDFVPEENNDLQRLDNKLEAGTISKPLGLVTGLKGANQPYPAFGGRGPEAMADFNLRISEHLRHKGRAITISDYERLILAEFPQVYRVKCLNHTLGRRGELSDYEMCPGFVTLVVIPDLQVVNADNIFQPKLPAADLQAIKTFLEDKISPFIRLEVLNPIYQVVKVRVDVQFVSGRSEDFYLKQLEKDLQVFLAPWSGETSATDISFGGSIFYSSALHFIEKLDYIDTVHRLTLVGPEPQEESESGPPIETEPAAEVELDVITASEARSVLTTSAEHELTSISEEQAGLENSRGVGYDKILK